MELRKSVRILACGTALLGIQLTNQVADAQDAVLVLNAEEESKSCLWPAAQAQATETRARQILEPPQIRCPYSAANHYGLPPVPFAPFLRQGHRTELRVYNRKFLADYSVTIDAVTSIASLPNIRNLNEAEAITFGASTFAGVPPSKGGAEGLVARNTIQVLYELLDEGTAGKPTADLDADQAILEREREHIVSELATLDKTFALLRGQVPPSHMRIDCHAVAGSPDAASLKQCFDDELQTEISDPYWGGTRTVFVNEDEFRKVLVRAQDLVGAVKTFAANLGGSDIASQGQKVVSDVAQYENDLVAVRGNIQAARDAARLASELDENGFRRKLQRQQLKLFLEQKLKPAQTSPLDEAMMNDVLNKYATSSRAIAILHAHWASLLEHANSLESALPAVQVFRASVALVRQRLGIELPQAIDDVNVAQSKLLARINEIYDKSEVSEPLAKQIDISGHHGNLIVYYTIRRVETFNRFTISPVPTAAAGQPTSSPPPAKGTTPSPTAAPVATPATAPVDDQPKPAPPPGIPVSSGSFEVHDFFHANVVAAFAISGVKDQSIAKLATPEGCGGSKANPDSNCFTPILNGGNRQQQVIIGLDYYLQPRDTFPGRENSGSWQNDWLCARHVLQCIGPMGAISVNRANNFFVGGFFEPVLGVQFAAGVNFGTETTLQRSFQFGTPADITGDFPTYDRRASSWFVTAGLDLGIFRKIFGKVTGLGPSASTTHGN
jgi:hypothetical protein